MPSQNSDEDYSEMLLQSTPEELPELSDQGVSVAVKKVQPITVTSEQRTSFISTQPDTNIASQSVALSSAEVTSEYPSSSYGSDSLSENLFFTKLVKGFSSVEEKVATEKELLSSKWEHIVAHMHEKLYEQKRTDALHEVESKILSRMKQLPGLENEWRSLNLQVAELTRTIKKREENLHILTDEIQGLVKEKSAILDDFENEYLQDFKKTEAALEHAVPHVSEKILSQPVKKRSSIQKVALKK